MRCDNHAVPWTEKDIFGLSTQDILPQDRDARSWQRSICTAVQAAFAKRVYQRQITVTGERSETAHPHRTPGYEGRNTCVGVGPVCNFDNLLFATLQGGGTGDSRATLRLFTDGTRSYSFKTPLQMRRFVGAALEFCKTYPSDVAYLLQCLGSFETAGRQRLAEICQLAHSIDVSCPDSLNVIVIHWCLQHVLHAWQNILCLAGWHIKGLLLFSEGHMCTAALDHIASHGELLADAMLQSHPGNCSRQPGLFICQPLCQRSCCSGQHQRCKLYNAPAGESEGLEHACKHCMQDLKPSTSIL